VDERLDMRIRTNAIDTAHRVAPWRADIAWWIVGVQGVTSLLLGLWLLVNQGAGEPVLAVVGLFVLLVASIQAWSAMRSDLPQAVLGWRGLRAGVSLMTGLVVVLDAALDVLTVPASLSVMALGLLLAGLLGVTEWFVGRDEMRWRWPTLLGPAVSLAVGAILIASRLQAAPVFLQVIAGVAVVLGVLLLVRAGILLREDRLGRGTGALLGASSTPTPIPQAGAGAGAPSVTVRSAASTRPPEDGPAA
jgi:uncharacterized membrane protein HdeD (DUF308 family)